MAEVLCGVCNSGPKKYKCPTCALPYCSLSCFREHKSTHTETAPTPTAPAPAPAEPEIPQPPAQAPIPRYLKKKTDFSVLATNPKFQELLKTYPALLPVLQRVYAATIEPDEDDQPRRGRGGGRGFRGRGRGRGRGGRYDGALPRWTQKQGDNDAMKMLKRYRDREDNDKEKQAMAAFVQLVEETFGDAET